MSELKKWNMGYLLMVITIWTCFQVSMSQGSAKPEWDGLRVTFRKFFSMPRTVRDALRQQFVKVSNCNESSPFRGSQYVKDGDKSVVLLFDKNEYIAGLQTMVPKCQPNGYPIKGLVPPFVEMDDGYYMTAYFVPPENICSNGRTSEEFVKQGTGTDLYIQNGNNPDTDYFLIPHNESRLSNLWVQGKCVPWMGKHYHLNISRDMDCDKFFPGYVMYTGGRLNAFGWLLDANLSSPYLEHSTVDKLPYVFKIIPKCLYKRGQMSNMHVYLTDRPKSIGCQ